MLMDLERAIEELDVDVDAAAIADVFALRARLDAKLAEAVAAFDRMKLWDLDHATSIVGWLRQHAGLTRRDAMRTTSVATRVAGLPVTAGAWAEGRLSEGQVETIVANLSAATAEVFAAHEGELIPLLAPLSVSETARAMGAWKARAEADGEPPPQPRRDLHLSQTLGDRWVLDGDLDAEGGHTVATALSLAESHDAPGDDRLVSRRRADALVDLCRFFLDHSHTTRGGRHRPHLNIVVDEADLAAGNGGHFVDGTPIDGASIRRLACDSALHLVVTRGRSTVVDYGRATRSVPAPLWNALVVRDEHCRFPGCDRRAAWCEGHHVRWFSAGGPTSIDNLVLLCSRHHHRLHLGRWRARLRPDATFEVTAPSGQVARSIPPRALPLVC
ncbi:MAG TPA: DUF222 domain-containing protein [Acidimicrobiales bacterium]|nr:DUF222 domain-containing protein [Acidimicrobiales bacterium]